MGLVADKWVERLNMETLTLKTLSSEGDFCPSYAPGEGTAQVFPCPTTQSVAGSCWQTNTELLLPY